MSTPKVKINHAKAKELIAIAERAIKVIEGIQAGTLIGDIIRETGAKRQLVEYYQKVLITKKCII